MFLTIFRLPKRTQPTKTAREILDFKGVCKFSNEILLRSFLEGSVEHEKSFIILGQRLSNVLIHTKEIHDDMMKTLGDDHCKNVVC